MDRKLIPTLLLALLVTLSLACGTIAPSTLPPAPVVVTATPDVQATINAALVATEQAKTLAQATIGAVVQATVGALPPTATPVPTVETVELSEEELETMINQAVEEAVTATTQASTTASQATADESMTSDEVETVEVYVQGAEQAIAYAEELITAYDDLYGALATEAMSEMAQVEQDLVSMAESIAYLSTSLDAVNATLQAGQVLSQETINQVASAAQVASANLTQVHDHMQALTQKATEDRENRTRQAANMGPNADAPTDLASTLSTAFGFLDQVRGALDDNKLDRDEMFSIAQTGANLSDGLNRHGGKQFQGLSGKVNEITGQLARGQVPHAKKGLNDFEHSLGPKPVSLPTPRGIPKPRRP
jgi:hypothetical protein